MHLLPLANERRKNCVSCGKHISSLAHEERKSHVKVVECIYDLLFMKEENVMFKLSSLAHEGKKKLC